MTSHFLLISGSGRVNSGWDSVLVWGQLFRSHQHLKQYFPRYVVFSYPGLDVLLGCLHKILSGLMPEGIVFSIDSLLKKSCAGLGIPHVVFQIHSMDPCLCFRSIPKPKLLLAQIAAFPRISLLRLFEFLNLASSLSGSSTRVP